LEKRGSAIESLTGKRRRNSKEFARRKGGGEATRLTEREKTEAQLGKN